MGVCDTSLEKGAPQHSKTNINMVSAIAKLLMCFQKFMQKLTLIFKKSIYEIFMKLKKSSQQTKKARHTPTLSFSALHSQNKTKKSLLFLDLVHLGNFGPYKILLEDHRMVDESGDRMHPAIYKSFILGHLEGVP